MKYGIWRIVGNAFPPRYVSDQNVLNVQTILEHEEPLENAEKVWVLNRIANQHECDQLHSLLEQHDQRVEIFPFDPDEFRRQSTDDAKYLYATGVNDARNWCIRKGLKTADVVIPLASDLMFRYDAWCQFINFSETCPDDPFYSFGVYRGQDLEEFLGKTSPVLRETYTFGAQTVIGLSEPKVAFTRFSDVCFDGTIPYGEFDNVELLYCLGIMGPWDRYTCDFRKNALLNHSQFFGSTPLASWVYKLPGEVEEDLEDSDIRRQDLKERAAVRLMTYLKELTA